MSWEHEETPGTHRHRTRRQTQLLGRPRGDGSVRTDADLARLTTVGDRLGEEVPRGSGSAATADEGRDGSGDAAVNGPVVSDGGQAAMLMVPITVGVRTADTVDALRAMSAGAAGYLLKDIDPHLITVAIETAARGGTYLPPQISAKAIAALRNPAPQLTRREREVVNLLATGASNAEIAGQFVVTEATVKSHFVNVVAELGVDSRARAIRAVEDLGLV